MEEQNREEQRPLLSTPSSDRCAAPARGQQRAVLVAGSIMLFTLELGSGALNAPFMQLLEDAICRKRYGGGSQYDGCDAMPIQSEIAHLVGWATTFKLIPTILLSVPFGLLADKLGRKLTLSLSLLGVMLTVVWQVVVVYFADTIDLRWIWACGVFAIIGGGNAVLTATIYAIVNDVSTPEDRLLVAMFMPETKPDTAKLAAGNDATADDEVVPSSSYGRLRRGSRESIALLRHQLFGDIFLSVALFTAIFTTMGKTVLIVLMQYAAKRFHWKWEEANLLNGLILLVGIIMMTIILPMLDKFLRKRRGMTLLKKDIWLVRLSFLALFIGSLTIGASPTPGLLIIGLVIYGLGSANEPSMRGLIAQAAGDRAATVFTTMTALELLGQAGASPAMAGLLSVGMGWGGFWRALPFLVASLIFFLASMVYWLVSFRLPEAIIPDDTTTEDEDGLQT
ncbi:Major facilitator superfamily domain, general substrate transporter [Akanthomyces lecanii RCEF 1005]|uniref:Major facilitator superfamily domain, general substrate transporter n=1 Tax=Akanthomyces lecanii RCEF 1005 TaxID=1081108 RepID=A0A167NBJ3_CORDF|nr:Major facilitator superfamily domain, general substrate transporter [Akanthomyces lecanii RCEF 1005]